MPFLWFSLCAYGGFPYDPYLSSLGRKHDIQNLYGIDGHCYHLIVTTGIARVQSSAKTQIAYSSIAQIGLMFVWVALGWHWFATLHFMANAFLRTYQLLVSFHIELSDSRSVFNFIQPQQNFTKGFLGKLKMSLYILSIREFLLDDIMFIDFMGTIEESRQLD